MSTLFAIGQGGDSHEVTDQLKDVSEIQSTEAAFAAILADGSVVTWGDHHETWLSEGNGCALEWGGPAGLQKRVFVDLSTFPDFWICSTISSHSQLRSRCAHQSSQD